MPEPEYPDAKSKAAGTFQRAWELTGPIFGLDGSAVHDKFVEAHTTAITESLNEAYRSGLAVAREEGQRQRGK